MVHLVTTRMLVASACCLLLAHSASASACDLPTTGAELDKLCQGKGDWRSASSIRKTGCSPADVERHRGRKCDQIEPPPPPPAPPTQPGVEGPAGGGDKGKANGGGQESTEDTKGGRSSGGSVVWEPHIDTGGTGDRYWHNSATGETTWDEPPHTPGTGAGGDTQACDLPTTGAELDKLCQGKGDWRSASSMARINCRVTDVERHRGKKCGDDAGAGGVRGGGGGTGLDGSWVLYTDTDGTGNPYWFNPTTGETTWDDPMPRGIDIDAEMDRASEALEAQERQNVRCAGALKSNEDKVCLGSFQPQFTRIAKIREHCEVDTPAGVAFVDRWSGKTCSYWAQAKQIAYGLAGKVEEAVVQGLQNKKVLKVPIVGFPGIGGVSGAIYAQRLSRGGDADTVLQAGVEASAGVSFSPADMLPEGAGDSAGLNDLADELLRDLGDRYGLNAKADVTAKAGVQVKLSHDCAPHCDAKFGAILESSFSAYTQLSAGAEVGSFKRGATITLMAGVSTTGKKAVVARVRIVTGKDAATGEDTIAFTEIIRGDEDYGKTFTDPLRRRRALQALLDDLLRSSGGRARRTPPAGAGAGEPEHPALARMLVHVVIDMEPADGVGAGAAAAELRRVQAAGMAAPAGNWTGAGVGVRAAAGVAGLQEAGATQNDPGSTSSQAAIAAAIAAGAFVIVLVAAVVVCRRSRRGGKDGGGGGAEAEADGAGQPGCAEASTGAQLAAVAM